MAAGRTQDSNGQRRRHEHGNYAFGFHSVALFLMAERLNALACCNINPEAKLSKECFWRGLLSLPKLALEQAGERLWLNSLSVGRKKSPFRVISEGREDEL